MLVFWCPRVALQSQTLIRFPAVKQKFILEFGAEKSTYQNKLDVRKPLAVCVFQRSEQLQVYNLLVYALTISEPGLEAVFVQRWL
jgi:hypothetical protein